MVSSCEPAQTAQETVSFIPTGKTLSFLKLVFSRYLMMITLSREKEKYQKNRVLIGLGAL
jgi:hypothetical protein